MPKLQKTSLFLLRIVLGWLYFYAGITKVMDPEWSAGGYLKGAKAFKGLYAFFASPSVLPMIDFLNQWGLTLIGVALILGISIRLAATFGVTMMILYYLPLGFPYPNAHSLIVDEHIVYSAALIVLCAFKAGKTWGLEEKFRSSRFMKTSFGKMFFS
ncbi:MAG: hypothetical protein COU07_02755 [Candidatus Harrisonbacteria bacterium CG10_big_fil_rev_8_21_14_0_10_40_38]|uniref:DoxX family protein n=1 Tax=Candidatus Harrisonbacteria bacterium CG10_big_fil_rev_8_21_14_0_10_40_38 TaxID=1974583 RepID=A0A2H0UTM2_9BACT|nr:MAG: hypothetical protein COU07_02755 [Candidatus Harrisonbacteria bacterium CG10_big_fil_rev_8_21_14_0_10_40_38]